MSDILKDLNPEQLKAVTTTDGPLLIIAGAGTGKTTVIAKRMAYIIEKKLAKPSEILALTFTDKAAGEMEERVDILVPYGFIDTWISTFHAFGDRVLRENAFDLGLSPDFKVMSRPQQVLFFQQNLFRFKLEYYRPLGNPTKFISAILSFFSRLKDENVSPKDFLKFASSKKQIAKSEDSAETQKYQELANCYQSYEQFKNEAGLLDFGDQVVKTLELFRNRPKILKNYQQQFKYVLVDEYQDTNYAQNELVTILSSAHKNICVNGDDDQSIYRFRGAAISNILEFKKTYPKAAQVVLTQNYRSTQSILDGAYRLIKHNDPDRLEVQNNIDKKLRSSVGAGLPPQELFAETLSEEADKVVEEIEKLTANKTSKVVMSSSRPLRPRSEARKRGSRFSIESRMVDNKFSLRSNNKYTYKDFSILVRANSQADHFLRALNLKGIPHKFVGSSGLYQREEVNILISFLTTITNFEDSLNLFNLLTSEVYEMPIEDAIKVTSYSRRKNRALYYVLKCLDKTFTNSGRHSFSSIRHPRASEDQILNQVQDDKEEWKQDLEISEKSKTIIEKFKLDLEEAIKSSAKLSAGRVLYNFLQKTDYLKKLDKGAIEGQIKIQNIAKFFEKIKEFESVTTSSSVRQFVDYLEAIRSAGDDPATVDYDPDLNAVNVMTVHGAKGLEFPVVFMVGLVSDRFPTRSRSEAIEIPAGLIKETLPVGDWHLQEERRLFYVGVTRAKNLLYFSWSRDAGGVRAKKISPFILEALDQVKPLAETVKLSPKEKIEKFAPTPPSASWRTRQTVMFDVDVLKLTQGSIDDYLTCAYKYRYIHILKIPIMRHHAIAYGAALHSAVGAFLNSKKNGKLLTLPQLLEVFENAWDSEGFLTIEHEEKRKAQGKLALSAFWKRESKILEKPTLIESKFSFSLKDITIVGRFDRVDIKPGSKVTIIDYKSSENIDQGRADSQAKESTQLGIYALYYWKKHQILPQKVALHFLENGIEGSYTPTEKHLKDVENLILETAGKIRINTQANKFPANPKYFGREPACNYCAYNSICAFSLAKI